MKCFFFVFAFDCFLIMVSEFILIPSRFLKFHHVGDYYIINRCLGTEFWNKFTEVLTVTEPKIDIVSDFFVLKY